MFLTILKQNTEILLEQFVSFGLASKDNVTAFVLEFQQEFCQLIVKLVKRKKPKKSMLDQYTCMFLHIDPVIGFVLLQCSKPAIPVKFASAFYSAF